MQSFEKLSMAWNRTDVPSNNLRLLGFVCQLPDKKVELLYQLGAKVWQVNNAVQLSQKSQSK